MNSIGSTHHQQGKPPCTLSPTFAWPCMVTLQCATQRPHFILFLYSSSLISKLNFSKFHFFLNLIFQNFHSRNSNFLNLIFFRFHFQNFQKSKLIFLRFYFQIFIFKNTIIKINFPKFYNSQNSAISFFLIPFLN